MDQAITFTVMDSGFSYNVMNEHTGEIVRCYPTGSSFKGDLDALLTQAKAFATELTRLAALTEGDLRVIEVDHHEALDPGVQCWKCDIGFAAGNTALMVKDQSPTGQHVECLAHHPNLGA